MPSTVSVPLTPLPGASIFHWWNIPITLMSPQIQCRIPYFHPSALTSGPARESGARSGPPYSIPRLKINAMIPAPAYVPGRKLWPSFKDFPLKGSSKKLSPRFLGPFPINSVLSSTAVHLRLPAHLRVHPAFHLLQIRPVLSSPVSLKNMTGSESDILFPRKSILIS